MDQRTIRYGIIGFGKFAERAIAPAIRNAPGSVLVAIQKRSAEESRKKADEAGVPLAFHSVQDLVRHPDIDAVFIVSANSAHCPETVAAAEAGKHVLVEKPMALTVDEAERMVDACSRNNVRLMVGHMVRYSPLLERAREIMTAGQIGTVTAVRTEFTYDGRLSHRTWLLDRSVAGGGPVYDIGVHCIDSIRFLLGEEPEAVGGLLSPPPTSVATEESAAIALRFPRGVLATVYCSYIAPVRRTLLEVIGTEGVIQVPDFTRSDIQGNITVIRGKHDRAVATTVEEIIVPDLYVDEVGRFTRWILGGNRPEIDGENGLKNQKILDRILTAAS
jgi:1,5-anhydro-D-fructose reductase (1,5-anhydro-D-mannitol-forming)